MEGSVIARWAAALLVAAACSGAATAKAERARHIQTLPAYLYLLPPVIYPLPALHRPDEH
jgi:hypothetical protein